MERDEKNRLFELFISERDKLFRFVRRKIQSISSMDAEDIIGEVMLGIFNRSDKSGPVENLTAYVYRSIHNKIVDYQKEKPRTVSIQASMDEDGKMPFLAFLSDAVADAGSELEKKEIMKRINEAIGGLEPKQRAVFIATEIKGISFRKLSEDAGVPIGTLLSRKCRAVKALRQTLKDIEE